jgi:Leucine-rich repeat (LRR) protein
MLPELKVLFVQGNDIVRVEGLNACYKLRELVMDKNRIKFVDADGFSGLTNLRELRLEENGLRT